MIKVDISGLKEAVRFVDEYGKQGRYAAAVALTKTAKRIQSRIVEEMSSRFDRPTSMTLKSIMVSPATKTKLEAKVWLKDREIGGKQFNSMSQIIGHQFTGGERISKRLEMRLRRLGLLPGSMYVAPGRGAGLDSYGNINRGTVTKILSRFGSLGGAGMSDRSFASLKKKGLLVGRGQGKRGSKGFVSRKVLRSEFFVARSKSSKPLGVWQLIGRGKVVPVLGFISKPNYQRRIDFYNIADKVVDQHFEAEFDKALEGALRTARHR